MKKIVLSLGGSLIVPDEINSAFLKKFRELILSKIDEYQFVIVCGGGKTARRYQDGGAAVTDMTSEQLDWLGIYSSHLNAHLVQSVFAENARNEIVVDYDQQIELNTPITIGAGWKPGHSTDFDAVQIAINIGAERVVNLSNIEYVYDKDPKEHADAVILKDLTWADFRKIVGDVWTPGLNMPFDPIASKLAEEHKLEVIIANGGNIENIGAIINGSEFIGSVIHP